MIGYVRGTVHGDVVVTTAGVGYVVTTPDARTDGEDVELWVHTVVREDSITLYGFGTTDERDVFAALLRVRGVGPQAGLAVLRDAGCGRLAAAVAAGDPKLLGKVKGVGPKLAAAIVAEVRLPDGLIGAADVTDELADTLERLGFEPVSVAAALREVRDADPDGEDTSWLAAALARLRAA
jgi:Holliday junction DNA helicase RuvA